MLEICALASGSNGNCYYIGNEWDAVLIDAGISCKQILNRMVDRQLSPQKIKAIFITHEHGDHSRGALVLGKRLQVPVYITAKTYNKLYKTLKPQSPVFFKPGDEIKINSFKVASFLKNHDAGEPCSFRVENGEKSIGVFTDIGEPCSRVIDNLKRCDAVFLESNYDEEMLWEGHYPYYLKRRIASNEGHLSNVQTLELLKNHATEKLKCVFLSHLSKENNTPEVAFETMQPLAEKFDIRLTSRYEASEVYNL